MIESGLAAGEHLIVEGTLKAKEGTVVEPKPFAAPAEHATAMSGAH